MDLLAAALCVVLAVLHRTVAFDRQYSAEPQTYSTGWDCGVHCRLPASAPLESLSAQLVAAPVDPQTEAAADLRPEAAPRKRSSQYTHYPSRFQSEQYKECKPTSGQIVRLLQALHAARKGEPHQQVTLCDNTRSVGNIQTNMRFFG